MYAYECACLNDKRNNRYLQRKMGHTHNLLNYIKHTHGSKLREGIHFIMCNVTII